MNLIMNLLTVPGGHLSVHMVISTVCSLMGRFGLDMQKTGEFSQVQVPLVTLDMALLVLSHGVK